jgi:arylesterase / paraoxonase
MPTATGTAIDDPDRTCCSLCCEVDYKVTPATVTELAVNIPRDVDFHPLGAAVFQDQSTKGTTLFVASCRRDNSTVEIFHFDSSNAKLTWQRTIAHPLIPNANAIRPISSTQFYVTNDHRFRQSASKALHMMETFTQFSSTYTTFVDFSGPTISAQKVVSLEGMTNGIASTPDLSQIFIAESGRGAFGIYNRNPTTNTLTFSRYVRINGHPDNLHFVSVGYRDANDWGQSFVVVGVHPNIFLLRRAVAGGVAPSWIVTAGKGENVPAEERVGELHRTKKYGEDWDVRTLVQDGGEWFSGATGAVVDVERGVMVGSGLYDSHGAYVCRKTR